MTTPRRTTKRSTETVVRGTLCADDLYGLIQKAVPDAPPDATIEIHVEIPGGGDWSNMNMDIDGASGRQHVHYTVAWIKETEVQS